MQGKRLLLTTAALKRSRRRQRLLPAAMRQAVWRILTEGDLLPDLYIQSLSF